MKKTSILLSLILLVSCTSQPEKTAKETVTEKEITEQAEEKQVPDVADAAKKIHESFYNAKTASDETIGAYLEADSIKITTEHSLSGEFDVSYLTGADKMHYFTHPKKFNEYINREKTRALGVKGACYVFETEGLLHNTLYIQKLCFKTEGDKLSLTEIFLLDGD